MNEPRRELNRNSVRPPVLCIPTEVKRERFTESILQPGRRRAGKFGLGNQQNLRSIRGTSCRDSDSPIRKGNPMSDLRASEALRRLTKDFGYRGELP